MDEEMRRIRVIETKIALYEGLLKQYEDREFIDKINKHSNFDCGIRVAMYKTFLKDLKDIRGGKLENV